MEEIAQLVSDLTALAPDLKLGYLTAYAGLSTLFLRALQSPGVQKLLPVSLRWRSWSKWVAQIVVLGTSILVTTGGAFFTGSMGIGAALLAAVPVAIGATFGHKSTQAVGRRVRSVQPHPVSISRPLSLIVPHPTLSTVIRRVRKARKP